MPEPVKKCNVKISSIGGYIDNCETNMSGIKHVYYIPVGDIQKLDKNKPASITSFEDLVTIGSSTMEGKIFTEKTEKGWGHIYSTKDMGELTYQPQGASIGCKSVKATLNMFNPGFKKKMLGFLSYMMNQEMLLIVLTNGGEYHLLGDLERGAEIDNGTKATSGKATTDNNGAELTFTVDEPTPQIIYDGWDPADELKGIKIIEEVAVPAAEVAGV